MEFFRNFQSSTVTQDLTDYHVLECGKVAPLQSKPSQCPLIFFLRLCSYIFYVPFGVTWNTSTNCFKLTENKVRKLFCGIVHTLVLAYNIIILSDHIHNFSGVSRSVISECFVLVCDLTAAVLWLSFIKIVWFDKHQLECILNSLTSKMFKGKHSAIIKSILIGMAIVYSYHSYNFLYTDLKLLSETNEIHSNFRYTHKVIRWTSKNVILRITHMYVFLFYFIEDSFIFALNCSLLANAWNFRKELISIGIHNQEKVFTVF